VSVRRVTWRTARRHRSCDGCGRGIAKGTRYAEIAYSPGWDGINGPRWVTLRCHGENTTDCP
jgi:hypothetical protein